MTLRCEHDPDFFTTLGSRYGTLAMLVLCDCREYIAASKETRTLLGADFAGPFPGAQFLGIRISEDVEVAVGKLCQ